MQRIILASASPRRAELLRAAGIAFDVLPADVDETPRAGELPHAYVCRLAEEKARAVAVHARNYPVLAADTTVIADGQILGKPADDDDARRMLHMLSGATHEVVTGVALMHGGQLQVHVEVTSVEFAEMTDEEIGWYVATGEPRDKAGAYAIQGYASRFITRVDGSYSNVVGLPIALVYQMLASAGVQLTRNVSGLREVDGLSTADAAACLGVSEDVVKTRLSRGRAALRRRLAERAGMLAPETFRFAQPRCDRVVAAVFARIS